MEFLSHSEQETEEFARQLAEDLRPGDILLLEGDLGAGKSTLARALIRYLSDEPGLEVPSPTFTLVQTYETRRGIIWHYDLYRIKDPDEIWELGWEDALADGIVIVEWPERLRGLAIPKKPVKVRMTVIDHSSRKIERL